MPFPLIGAAVKIGAGLVGKAKAAASAAKAQALARATTIPSRVTRAAAKVAVAGGGGIVGVAAERALSAGVDRAGNMLGGRKRPKKIRRQNPANPKALRRAIRRVDRAQEMFGQLLSATRGKRVGGFHIKARGLRK